MVARRRDIEVGEHGKFLLAGEALSKSEEDRWMIRL
jgi:hypothetical protein